MPSLSSRAVFQSTRPVWGATHSPASDPGCARISIHAPRVGRDSGRRLAALRTTTFQSTRPVWGATTRTTGRACRHGQFQSTRPVWGATRAGSLSLSLSTYFNPRAPCGARPERPGIGAMVASDFNPRAPCGARPGDHRRLAPAVYFNPRAPCGARRFYAQSAQKDAQNFNPRAPCGARPVEINFSTYVELFQSTRPVWGATPSARVVDQKCRISIHAPRVGRDCNFRRGRPEHQISIHAPRVGRDQLMSAVPRLSTGFQSTRPVWGATSSFWLLFHSSAFQSTRPVWGATIVIFSPIG